MRETCASCLSSALVDMFQFVEIGLSASYNAVWSFHFGSEYSATTFAYCWMSEQYNITNCIFDDFPDFCQTASLKRLQSPQ
jgi:hypothetical protein